MKLLAAMLVLTLSTSCFVGRETTNEPLPLDSLAALTPGETTAREATERLGAPDDVVQLGKRSAYLYRHGNTKRAGLLLIVVGLFNEDSRSDRIWLFFDENDVLSHAAATHASHRAGYSLPWNDLYDAEDKADDDAYRRRQEQGANSAEDDGE